MEKVKKSQERFINIDLLILKRKTLRADNCFEFKNLLQ
jgi:hypothetical protein